MKKKLLAVVLCVVTACALFVSAGADEAKDTVTFRCSKRWTMRWRTVLQ